MKTSELQSTYDTGRGHMLTRLVHADVPLNQESYEPKDETRNFHHSARLSHRADASRRLFGWT